MKKLLFGLAAAIGLTLFSCNNDDNVLPEQRQPAKYEINIGETLKMSPPSHLEGASYRWIVNGEPVSSSETFSFKATRSGISKVILETRQNGNLTRTTYAVSVSYQLQTTLSSYTLNASNGTSTTGGYYWNQTYSNTRFTSGIFTFSHTGGVQSGYNYWDGFTVSNVADVTNYGAPGSSNGWINHQWGSMAVNTSSNFLIGYWGYYMKDYQSGLTNFSESGFSNWVKIGDGSATYNAQEVKVSIHPWPYYGILYGDGFARKFALGDYFLLKIYGVNASNQIVGPVNYYMVDYRNSVGTIVTSWKTVNITALGAVKYLMFQMESTDNSAQYGPNTAVYFCLNNIKVSQN